jgi:hypothetical protein
MGAWVEKQDGNLRTMITGPAGPVRRVNPFACIGRVASTLQLGKFAFSLELCTISLLVFT